MDYKDLKDSYSKLSDAVEELAGEGKILVVRTKDGNPRVLFYNDPEQNTHMDDGNVFIKYYYTYLHTYIYIMYIDGI